MKQEFFHMCAKGADSRNFILSESDFYAAFNLMGVCAANTDVVIVSFSIEESHPHALLWGTCENCIKYKNLYETQYVHYAAAGRPGGSDMVFHCELYPIGDDLDYLRNVAVYTIIQPTKDGKQIMPYDYRWGTGSMYFRTGHHTPVWYFDEKGIIHQPVSIGSLGKRNRNNLLHSRILSVPDDWLVCNGFILPDNYVDVGRFESIYGTFNRFRVYLSSPRSREEAMLARMAEYRGVVLEDIEARKICAELSRQLFSTSDSRKLDATQRIVLARQLRRQFKLTFRQLSTLVRLPETEIRTFVR